ncbi:unnamed protein product [Prunus brigantina]
MAFVVGQGGKNLVLSSAAKKWKDFKSTLTRHYILPYIKEREKLSQPPELYKFLEKSEWDAFVASRLSQEFVSVHSQHSHIMEKLEYNLPKHNHRLSRKGYAGLEDEFEETMPGVEIDRSTLWKKARQDKHGNILDPKVAEKTKLIDELQKQVLEGSLSVSGSNDVLTMALGPEHPGRVRGVEETKKMEARSREETLRMEARTKQLVEAERENLLSQLSQLIPNFDPSMLKPKTSPCQNQSPKNPMSDKASYSGANVRSLHFEDDTAKNGEKQEEMKSGDLENQDEEKKEEKKDEEKKEEKQDEEKKEKKEDEEKHDEKTSIVSLNRRLCLYDHLKEANMFNMVGFIDPAQVSANAGSLTNRSRLVASRLKKTDGEQIFMMPYNPGRHWVLLIVRAKKETVYFLDPLLGNHVICIYAPINEEAKNMVNSAIKIYNSHLGRQGRKAPIWKTLPGTPKQPSSVECGYYVMRFMRNIIMDPSLEFEKTFAKGKEQAPYPQAAIDEVRNEWAEFVCLHME